MDSSSVYLVSFFFFIDVSKSCLLGKDRLFCFLGNIVNCGINVSPPYILHMIVNPRSAQITLLICLLPLSLNISFLMTQLICLFCSRYTPLWQSIEINSYSSVIILKMHVHSFVKSLHLAIDVSSNDDRLC